MSEIDTSAEAVERLAAYVQSGEPMTDTQLDEAAATLRVLAAERDRLVAEVEAREQAARREVMEEAARIADGVEPSAASAVGEAHMRSFRNAIAYAIRAAAKEGSDE